MTERRESAVSTRDASRPRVVIIGGGFAGLNAVRALRRAPVDVTLLDRANHHLFQPLLYQVATAALSPADIAQPLRHIFSRQKNARVLLASARSIDVDRRIVRTDVDDIPYDYLVLAAGAETSYFVHDEWAGVAPGLKTIADALCIRNRFLLAFEDAENSRNEGDRRALLTFVIVGAGPTGVELAGAMADIALRAIPRDFRNVDTRTASVLLLEMKDQVLPTYPRRLAQRAKRDLERLGVDVRLGARVTGIDSDGLDLMQGDQSQRIECRNVVWAAGVKPSPLAHALGALQRQCGRVTVNADLSVPDHPEIFVAGDLARFVDPDTNEEPPAIAPTAIQMGRHAGRVIAQETRAGAHPANRPVFHYRARGELATIGRAKAVGIVYGRHVTGALAWLLWLGVHLYFLIGFRNRIIVLIQWAWAYFTFQRGARIITEAECPARPAPTNPPD